MGLFDGLKTMFDIVKLNPSCPDRLSRMGDEPPMTACGGNLIGGE